MTWLAVAAAMFSFGFALGSWHTAHKRDQAAREREELREAAWRQRARA